MALGKNFKATLEVISPVHIDSGRGDLLSDYDFTIGRERCALYEAWDNFDIPEGVASLNVLLSRIEQYGKLDRTFPLLEHKSNLARQLDALKKFPVEPKELRKTSRRLLGTKKDDFSVTS